MDKELTKTIVEKFTSGKFLITIMTCMATCYLYATQQPIPDGLQTVFSLAVGAYFGQSLKK